MNKDPPLAQLTMRRFDNSLPIALKSSDSVAPVEFQNSFAGLLGSVGSMRKRESDEQVFSVVICAASAVLLESRSSAMVITMTPAALALSQSVAKCSLIALV